jgi:hypothetical protein
VISCGLIRRIQGVQKGARLLGDKLLCLIVSGAYCLRPSPHSTALLSQRSSPQRLLIVERARGVSRDGRFFERSTIPSRFLFPENQAHEKTAHRGATVDSRLARDRYPQSLNAIAKISISLPCEAGPAHRLGYSELRYPSDYEPGRIANAQ